MFLFKSFSKFFLIVNYILIFYYFFKYNKKLKISDDNYDIKAIDLKLNQNELYFHYFKYNKFSGVTFINLYKKYVYTLSLKINILNYILSFLILNFKNKGLDK